MRNSGFVHAVITRVNKQEKEFIRETEAKFRATLGNDYYITYNGGLSWTMRPLLKSITITGEIGTRNRLS
jgi:hypothetical protein